MPLPIFIDIDGTLTDRPYGKWGKVFEDRLGIVRGLIEKETEIVLWTGGGSEYAKLFADKYNLTPLACIGKPHLVVDDNPTIRPKGRISILAPEKFFTGVDIRKGV